MRAGVLQREHAVTGRVDRSKENRLHWWEPTGGPTSLRGLQGQSRSLRSFDFSRRVFLTFEHSPLTIVRIRSNRRPRRSGENPSVCSQLDSHQCSASCLNPPHLKAWRVLFLSSMLVRRHNQRGRNRTGPHRQRAGGLSVLMRVAQVGLLRRRDFDARPLL